MESHTYFAYGSNMLHLRLQERCASAQPICAAFAPGWVLEFTKQSQDGSGKATLVRSPDPSVIVHGVLFNIAEGDLVELDEFEGRGKGYDRDDNFAVLTATNQNQVIAKTYLAVPKAITSGLSPYDWYHALVLRGAEQNKLPADHIDRIRQVRPDADPMPRRKTRLDALRILERSGFSSTF